MYEAPAFADASLEAARKANDKLAEAYALNNKANSLRMLDRMMKPLPSLTLHWKRLGKQTATSLRPMPRTKRIACGCSIGTTKPLPPLTLY